MNGGGAASGQHIRIRSRARRDGRYSDRISRRNGRNGRIGGAGTGAEARDTLDSVQQVRCLSSSIGRTENTLLTGITIRCNSAPIIHGSIDGDCGTSARLRYNEDRATSSCRRAGREGQCSDRHGNAVDSAIRGDSSDSTGIGGGAVRRCCRGPKLV